jgi:uncharacterized phage protein (TIGR02218 family)
MKSASAAMDTLLATNGPFFMADLYTITLLSGTVLRFTSADVPLTVSGQTYLNTGPTLSRTKTRLTLGLEVATMDIEISADDTQLLLGTPWIHAIRQGKLDGAIIRVDLLMAPDWTDTSAGSIPIFEGEVRDTDAARLTAKVTVASIAYKFDMNLPKNSYTPSCGRTLYDTGCKAVKATFSASSAAGSGSTNTSVTSALAQATGYFDLGVITFTSGANNGISRTVRGFAGGTFDLSLPLPVQPTPGDTFTAAAGCDRTQSTCTNKFSNMANFRGFPFVPNPESIL